MPYIHTMKKVTFTLDESAIRMLERAAERLDAPKSQVVREAIELYGDQLGRLSDEERERMLATFDRVMPTLPDREAKRVEEEIAEVRRSRKRGGRASSGEDGP